MDHRIPASFFPVSCALTPLRVIHQWLIIMAACCSLNDMPEPIIKADPVPASAAPMMEHFGR